MAVLPPLLTMLQAFAGPVFPDVDQVTEMAMEMGEAVDYVSVRNNTRATFRCRFRSGEWASAIIRFAPAQQVDHSLVESESINLQCYTPVNSTFIGLRPANRYNFLRKPDGSIRLFRIDPSAP